jgi:pimeloyl-ACP methyl ester carboxylesterase
MHYLIAGKGNPTVVFEAGAGAFSFDFHLVQTKVAKFTQTFSYDRAGHAWSGLGPKPRTMKQAVYDLRMLLQKAGLQPPYILVGHSHGGKIIRVFAAEFTEEVAGMVFIDSGFENSLAILNGKKVREWDAAKARPIPPVRTETAKEDTIISSPVLKSIADFQKLTGPVKIEPPFDKLPSHIQQSRLWATMQPRHYIAEDNEYIGEELVVSFAWRITHPFALGNKPVIVISRKPAAHKAGGILNEEDVKQMEEERLTNIDLLTKISHNSLSITANSGHEIHLDQPELVTEAIRQVVEASRSKSRLVKEHLVP